MPRTGVKAIRRMIGVEIERHESELGGWTFVSWQPLAATPLDGSIARIWYFEGTLGSARERVFPDGTLELIAQLDEPHKPGTGQLRSAFPPFCVTGVRTTAEVIEAPPNRCRVLGVRLTPRGAFAVLRAPLAELTALTLDLGSVVGPAAAELETRLREARDGATAVAVAAGWAARRLARGPVADPTVQSALRAIAADGGSQSIAALRAWEGRSRARFAAAFRDQVGVSPKRFARIVRFDRALRAVAQTRAPLGEIALSAGYYDQAHFTTEFREHAGLTPRAYRCSVQYPGSTSLADGAEQLFQDAAS